MNPTNAPEKPNRPRSSSISSEAIIGIGVTIGSLGVLGLLLGWAEAMRGVASVSMVWFPLGAVLLILGLLIAGFGWSRKQR